MTARQVYEGVLIELNKVQAPSLLLEDFNYLFNKAINQYINKQYNIYDVNQQTTDDLRVLKATAKLSVKKDYNSNNQPISDSVSSVTDTNSLYGAVYQFDLPKDYLHLLNCICDFEVLKPFKCYDAGTHVQFGATRLTSDIWSLIINNFYMRPSYKRPYYFINNINNSSHHAETPNKLMNEISDNHYIPTNPILGERGTDTIDIDGDKGSVFTGTFKDSIISGEGDFMIGPITLNEGDSISTEEIDTHGGDWLGLWDEDAENWVGQPGAYIHETILANGHHYYIVYKQEDTAYTKFKYTVVRATQTGPIKDKFGNVYGKWDPRASLKRTILTGNDSIQEEYNAVEKVGTLRYGNPSNVRMEIRYGKDNSLFKLDHVYIDYLKTPQHIRLTQEQLDWTEDTSQIMEFPDFVCQEIINELVHIVMENASDPRLQTHIPVSQSIANPAQALAQSQQK